MSLEVYEALDSPAAPARRGTSCRGCFAAVLLPLGNDDQEIAQPQPDWNKPFGR